MLYSFNAVMHWYNRTFWSILEHRCCWGKFNRAVPPRLQFAPKNLRRNRGVFWKRKEIGNSNLFTLRLKVIQISIGYPNGSLLKLEGSKGHQAPWKKKKSMRAGSSTRSPDIYPGGSSLLSQSWPFSPGAADAFTILPELFRTDSRTEHQ